MLATGLQLVFCRPSVEVVAVTRRDNILNWVCEYEMRLYKAGNLIPLFPVFVI